MGRGLLDITMSLDGFVTGPGADLAHGLGVGGEPLHDWIVADDLTDADREALDRTQAGVGAVLMGRRTFDFVDGPHGWAGDAPAPPPRPSSRRSLSSPRTGRLAGGRTAGSSSSPTGSTARWNSPGRRPATRTS